MNSNKQQYKYDEDDKGVACRYSEDDSWEALEAHCLSCGYRDDDCNCGNHIPADYINEDKDKK